MENAKAYGLLLTVLLVAFLLGGKSSSRMTALFGGLIIGLLAIGIFAEGNLAKWAILGIGLFCSVMWSNIFSLAIEGLGPTKGQDSALLGLASIGGAILPPVQGALADRFGIQASFIIPAIAFAYIVFYGLFGYKAGRSPVAQELAAD